MPKVYRGAVTGRFYFAPSIRRDNNGVWVMCGRKIDITDDLRPYLKTKYLPKDAIPRNKG